MKNAYMRNKIKTEIMQSLKILVDNNNYHKNVVQ